MILKVEFFHYKQLKTQNVQVCYLWVHEGLYRYASENQLLSKMFQRLSIALAQVKLGNTFENLLKEIPPIIYTLY